MTHNSQHSANTVRDGPGALLVVWRPNMECRRSGQVLSAKWKLHLRNFSCWINLDANKWLRDGVNTNCRILFVSEWKRCPHRARSPIWFFNRIILVEKRLFAIWFGRETARTVSVGSVPYECSSRKVEVVKSPGTLLAWIINRHRLYSKSNPCKIHHAIAILKILTSNPAICTVL